MTGTELISYITLIYMSWDTEKKPKKVSREKINGCFLKCAQKLLMKELTKRSLVHIFLAHCLQPCQHGLKH